MKNKENGLNNRRKIKNNVGTTNDTNIIIK